MSRLTDYFWQTCDWWTEPPLAQDAKSTKLVGLLGIASAIFIAKRCYMRAPDDEEYLLVCARMQSLVSNVSRSGQENSTFHGDWR